jgi:secreted PhoX family phosphatase
MIEAIESMLADMERGKLTRRQFAISLVATAAGVAATRGTLAAPPEPTELQTIRLNHVTVSVPDLLRTSESYGQFFGMPRRKQRAKLRILCLGKPFFSTRPICPRVERQMT